MRACPIGAAAAAEGAGLSRQDQEEGEAAAAAASAAPRSVGQRRAASLMQVLACLPLCTLVRHLLCQGSTLTIRASGLS